MDDKTKKAVIRLAKNPDFAVAMEYLVADQARIVLEMPPEAMPKVHMALIYYQALDSVIAIVNNLAEEAENG